MIHAPAQPARLGILISGRGSNMLALARACERGSILGDVALVASNVVDAAGLPEAQKLGLPTFALDHRGLDRAEFDEQVSAKLQEAGVTMVCLAGYMRLLSVPFVRQWEGRILNVHPSLLPAFTGVGAQAQALEAGVKVTGCTVHFVDEQLDHGPVILQEAVPVRDDDTVETLSDRILAVEHEIYPKAVALVAAGRVRVEGRRVVLA